MKKSNFFFSLYLNIHLFSALSFGQSYYDDFESYAVGGLLACQNSVNWTTYNFIPCDTVEDAIISTNHASSGTKSLLILPNDDLIKLLGNLTSGKRFINFDVFFPEGKAGYFNLMATFPGNIGWALEVFFPDGGIANINAGGLNAASFSIDYNTWFPVEIIIDLDQNLAELIVRNTSIHLWQWTMGSSGTGCALRLAALNFYGAYPNNEMYVDNFIFDGNLVSVESHIDNPFAFSLEQNYPNPFNPITKIKFTIPTTPTAPPLLTKEGIEGRFVSLKVYDILGNEVATLVNEKKSSGTYEVEFQATVGSHQLASGVYYYQLKAGSLIETKKMILLK